MLIPVIMVIVIVIIYAWLVPQARKIDESQRYDGDKVLVVILRSVVVIVMVGNLIALCAFTFSPLYWAILFDYRIGLAAKLLGIW